MEKKKITNMNGLSLILSYMNQVFQLLTKTLNDLTFSSKIVIFFVFGFFLFFFVGMLYFKSSLKLFSGSKEDMQKKKFNLIKVFVNKKCLIWKTASLH